MNKSELLKKQAEQEDNDLKALGLYTKVLREERIGNFEKKWLPKLKETHIVKKGPSYSYIIYSTRYGVIDFFPKANRCLLRKKSRWIKPGLQWIVKNLMQEK